MADTYAGMLLDDGICHEHIDMPYIRQGVVQYRYRVTTWDCGPQRGLFRGPGNDPPRGLFRGSGGNI